MSSIVRSCVQFSLLVALALGASAACTAEPEEPSTSEDEITKQTFLAAWNFLLRNEGSRTVTVRGNKVELTHEWVVTLADAGCNPFEVLGYYISFGFWVPACMSGIVDTPEPADIAVDQAQTEECCETYATTTCTVCLKSSDGAEDCYDGAIGQTMQLSTCDCYDTCSACFTSATWLYSAAGSLGYTVSSATCAESCSGAEPC